MIEESRWTCGQQQKRKEKKIECLYGSSFSLFFLFGDLYYFSLCSCLLACLVSFPQLFLFFPLFLSLPTLSSHLLHFTSHQPSDVRPHIVYVYIWYNDSLRAIPPRNQAHKRHTTRNTHARALASFLPSPSQEHLPGERLLHDAVDEALAEVLHVVLRDLFLCVCVGFVMMMNEGWMGWGSATSSPDAKSLIDPFRSPPLQH